MKERELRQSVINEAYKDLGATQYSERHAQIIRDFNKIPGMGSWMKTDYPWCAAAVSVWGYRAGLGNIFYPSASCNAMIQKYKEHGRWMELDNYHPEPGDVIMYDWEDPGSGDNRGEADHVGIVVKLENGIISVIEGNKGKKVGIRKLVINGRYIRGYCLPNYAKHATEEKDWTKALQAALNAAYDLHLDIDGSAGPLTRQAIDRHYLWYIKQNPIKNVHVSWLQEALNECGACLKVDGSFGPKTDAALRDFQREEGIDVDGYAGIQTHMKLLRRL